MSFFKQFPGRVVGDREALVGKFGDDPGGLEIGPDHVLIHGISAEGGLDEGVEGGLQTSLFRTNALTSGTFVSLTSGGEEGVRASQGHPGLF